MRKFLLVILSIASVIPFTKVVRDISLYYLVLCFGMILFILELFMDRSGRQNKPLLWSLFFLVLVFMGVMYSPNSSEASTIKICALPVVILCGLAYLLKSRMHLEFFIFSMLICVALSSLVAVLQAMNFTWAWEARLLLGVPEDIVVLRQLIRMEKPSGLAYFSVQLSYQIITIFPFVIYLRERYQKHTRKWIDCMAYTMIAAAVLSGAVSAMLVICWVGAVYFFSKGDSAMLRRYTVLAVVGWVVVAVAQYGYLDRLLKPDSSLLSRIPFFLMGSGIMLTHPFGVEASHLLPLKLKWLGNEFIRTLAGADWIIDTSFHNSFINAGVNYGIFVFLLYVWFYMYLLRVHWVEYHRRRSIDLVHAWFTVSMLTNLCGYLFQSSVHNAGLSSGDPYGWLIVGIALAEMQLKCKDNCHVREACV